MHEANTARYPRLIHVSGPKLANAGMGSNASPAPKPRTPATRNCTTVSSVMSRPRAYFAVYSTCRLRKNADSSVIRSPKRSENPESPANETQPTPATHTRAAAMLKRVGRGPRSAHPRNGMITQYSDVRNALFEAVVSVSPVEFAQYDALFQVVEVQRFPEPRQHDDAQNDARRGEAHAHEPCGRELVDGRLDDHGAQSPDGSCHQEEGLVHPKRMRAMFHDACHSAAS